MTTDHKQTVVVAGASGFIGRALPAALGDRYDLVGLTRDVDAARRPGGNYRWRRVDLFSRMQTQQALEGADLAVYLVHSLHPSARLTQGEAGDLDLICADNFARAARHHGIEYIVYISGIVPRASRGAYARRREVAQTLSGYDTPLTTLRAALVLGAGGVGTQMALRLARRAPFGRLPRWIDSALSPIARGDLVEIVAHLLAHPGRYVGAFDVGGPQTLTFAELLEIAADVTGRPRRFRSIPATALSVSARWVSLVTGQPRWAVRPIIESLAHDLVPADMRLQRAVGMPPTAPREALAEAHEASRQVLATVDAESRELVARGRPYEVRAVHRLALPGGRDARWVAREYPRWLAATLWPLVRVAGEPEQTLRIFVRPIPWPLLVLRRDEAASDAERQLYWVRGGLLAAHHEMGRLEFRQVRGRQLVLAALHEFHPRLPWLLYLGTQARIHHWVMGAFDRHLGRSASETGE